MVSNIQIIVLAISSLLFSAGFAYYTSNKQFLLIGPIGKALFWKSEELEDFRIRFRDEHIRNFMTKSDRIKHVLFLELASLILWVVLPVTYIEYGNLVYSVGLSVTLHLGMVMLISLQGMTDIDEGNIFSQIGH